jgi:hypothetical protein
MWSHFVDLFWRILHGMPLLVSSNWAAFGMGAGLFALYHIFVWSIRGSAEMRRQWKENIGIGLLATGTGYLLLFAWSGVVTTYDEHHDSNGRWREVVNEKNKLKNELEDRDQYIKRLEQAKDCTQAQPTARPAPRSAPQPPPSNAGLTVSYAPRINSRTDATYETEITVSTTAVFPGSLKLVMTCDHPLVKVEAAGSISRSMTMVYSDDIQPDRRVYVLSYGSSSPGFSPSSPLVFNVWSNQKITCSAQTS